MENQPGETAPADTVTTVAGSGAFGRLVRTVVVSTGSLHFV